MKKTTLDQINLQVKLFSDELKISFKNPDILREALTHRSFINTAKRLKIPPVTNERLEFLGDAVLEMIITEFLYIAVPDEAEGVLTSFRSALVCETSLAKVANDIKLGDYLLLSPGEENSGGREKSYLLANGFEALLGAIYLDQGYKTAQEFVIKNVTPYLKEIKENRTDINAKNKLQEFTQAKLGVTPRYKLIKASGPDHNKIFLVAVIIGKDQVATGEGNSKQKAEEDCANKAIEILTKTVEKK